jgi:hypothetical protein
MSRKIRRDAEIPTARPAILSREKDFARQRPRKRILKLLLTISGVMASRLQKVGL